MALVSGIIKFSIDGREHYIKGDNVTYNAVPVKRESETLISGQTVYKEMPQTQFVKGSVAERSDFDWLAFTKQKNVTIRLDLGQGKSYFFNGCFFEGETEANTGGELPFQFTALNGSEEVTSE